MNFRLQPLEFVLYQGFPRLDSCFKFSGDEGGLEADAALAERCE